MTKDEREVKKNFNSLRQKYARGHFPALIDAVVMCIEYRELLKPWMRVPILNALNEYLKHATVSKKGGTARATNPRSILKKRLQDLKRWEVLNTELAARGLQAKNLSFNSPQGGAPKTAERRAVTAASDFLKKIDEACTEKQIKTSWKRVQAAKDRGHDTYEFLTKLP